MNVLLKDMLLQIGKSMDFSHILCVNIRGSNDSQVDL